MLDDSKESALFDGTHFPNLYDHVRDKIVNQLKLIMKNIQ